MSMDEMRVEALLVGLVAGVLSFAVPGLCLWLLLRWKPMTRPLFALRSALMPLAAISDTLGGPLAHKLLGTSSVLGAQRFTDRTLGIIGLWCIAGPFAFAAGWFTVRGRFVRQAPPDVSGELTSLRASRTAAPLRRDGRRGGATRRHSAGQKIGYLPVPGMPAYGGEEYSSYGTA